MDSGKERHEMDVKVRRELTGEDARIGLPSDTSSQGLRSLGERHELRGEDLSAEIEVQ